MASDNSEVKTRFTKGVLKLIQKDSTQKKRKESTVLAKLKYYSHLGIHRKKECAKYKPRNRAPTPIYTAVIQVL